MSLSVSKEKHHVSENKNRSQVLAAYLKSQELCEANPCRAVLACTIDYAWSLKQGRADLGIFQPVATDHAEVNEQTVGLSAQRWAKSGRKVELNRAI